MTTTARKLSATAPPCIGYVRVSKTEQAAEDKASLGQQRAAIDLLAKRHGGVIGTVYEDPGKSGGSANRPGFQALMRYCELHPQPPTRPGFVCVLNDSRWGRFENPDEAAHWRFHLAKQGWQVRFVESDDTDDPIARGVMRAIGSGTSSQYREAIKRNSKRGARGTAEQGFYSNEAPLGYRRKTVGGMRPGTVLAPRQLKTKDERVRLTPGPESEQRVIRFMYEEYDGGMSSGVLVRELQKRWPGLRKWSRAVVRQIMMNPAYTGELRWMVRSNGPRDGDPVIVPNAHPALIKRNLWERVQARIKKNRRETRPTAGGYPLRGLITCSSCGAPYFGSGGPRGPDSEPDRYRFYRERPQAGRPCGNRQGTLKKRIIEPIVMNEVVKVVGDPKVQRAVADALHRLLGELPDTRRALDKERAALEAQRKRIVERIGQGLIEDAEAKPVLADLRARLEALAAEGDRAKFTAANRKAAAAERERLVGMATDFVARAKNVSGSALRDLLVPWLAGATFDKDTRTVTLSIRQVPFTNLISSPGRG